MAWGFTPTCTVANGWRPDNAISPVKAARESEYVLTLLSLCIYFSWLFIHPLSLYLSSFVSVCSPCDPQCSDFIFHFSLSLWFFFSVPTLSIKSMNAFTSQLKKSFTTDLFRQTSKDLQMEEASPCLKNIACSVTRLGEILPLWVIFKICASFLRAK